LRSITGASFLATSRKASPASRRSFSLFSTEVSDVIAERGKRFLGARRIVHTPYYEKCEAFNRALADLLLVEGDPLVDIAILQDHAKLAMIMKDGKIHNGLR